MQVKNVRDVTFELLRRLGIKTVFGNPGSTEETFLKNFPKDFRYVQTLHEASAVAMADAYAQATHNAALVNVHTSAGLCNAMSNIMTAFMNKTPLIISAGNQTREMLLSEPWLTNVEPALLPRPWVKWSYEPVRAADVPAAFMRAYAAAVQPPAGPVFLSIPLDDWDKPAEAAPVVRGVSTRIGADQARLADFAKIISGAKNPVLIYGAAIARAGAWHAGIKLAEKLNAPVWAAPASERTPFPETHALYAGVLPFAKGPLAQKLKGHDAALLIGAPAFRYYPYIPGDYLPKGLKLLHINDDPAETAKAPVGESLLADAGLSLDALIGLVKPRAAAKHKTLPRKALKFSKSTDGLLTPFELFKIVKESAPADAILMQETPSSLGALHEAWPIENPDSFYTFASGSLGWALPASAGMALAQKDLKSKRRVVSIIGDGSMQYSIQGLWDAARLKLPVLYVIPCNAEYAILKSFAKLEKTPNVPGLDIPGLDVLSLAKGYGCKGVWAKTAADIRNACAEAFLSNAPTVLAVPVTPVIPQLC